MRLIDADMLAEKKFIAVELIGYGENVAYRIGWNDAIDAIIENEPTIEPKTKVVAQVTFDEDKLREIVHEAVERFKEEYDIVDNPDAVSVVRCKECKHWSIEPAMHCSEHFRMVDADFFCADGEREGE